MNTEYKLVTITQAVNLTQRLLHDCKFFITQTLEEYDLRAQQKYTNGQYMRRGVPGDLILTPATVFTHIQDHDGGGFRP